MDKAINHLQEVLAGVRVGRASPGISLLQSQALRIYLADALECLAKIPHFRNIRLMNNLVYSSVSSPAASPH